MIDATVRFFELDAVRVDASLLSADEQARVARKATPALKQRQAASFHCLRVTLGDVLGSAPDALAFRLRESGKPELAGGGLHFNLSHSGGVGMLAWGPRELGVDVEALIARPGEGLAEEILTPRERDLWRSLPETAQRAWLTRAWTRKESALKAAGTGLRIAPRIVEVMGEAELADAPCPSHRAWRVDLVGRHWHGVDWLDGAPEGYLAALCVASA